MNITAAITTSKKIVTDFWGSISGVDFWGTEFGVAFCNSRTAKGKKIGFGKRSKEM